jgi:hypothetical protein
MENNTPEQKPLIKSVPEIPTSLIRVDINFVNQSQFPGSFDLDLSVLFIGNCLSNRQLSIN